MNPYYNLPPEQRLTQRLVDQFNTDERLWEEAGTAPPRPPQAPGKVFATRDSERIRPARIFSGTATTGMRRTMD